MCYPNGLDSWEGVGDGLGRLIALGIFFVLALAGTIIGG